MENFDNAIENNAHSNSQNPNNMKIVFIFKNKILNTRQLVNSFNEVENILEQLDLDITKEIINELGLPNDIRATIYKRIEEYNGHRLQITEIHDGSFVLKTTIAVMTLALALTLHESVKAGWKGTNIDVELSRITRKYSNRFGEKIVPMLRGLENILDSKLEINSNPHYS